MSLRVVRRLAAQAVDLFPVLADVSLLRTYLGFRPYCPDHLPIIGEDPRVPGLVHACGHEGAGIGLAAATAELLAQHLTDRDARPRPGARSAPTGSTRRRSPQRFPRDGGRPPAFTIELDGEPIARGARPDHRRRAHRGRAPLVAADPHRRPAARACSAGSASASTAW